MDSTNMARILQNMIEEAEENLSHLTERHLGIVAEANIASRCAELKEAVELEAELGGPLFAESFPAPSEDKSLDLIDRYKVLIDYDPAYALWHVAGEVSNRLYAVSVILNAILASRLIESWSSEYQRGYSQGCADTKKIPCHPAESAELDGAEAIPREDK